MKNTFLLLASFLMATPNSFADSKKSRKNKLLLLGAQADVLGYGGTIGAYLGDDLRLKAYYGIIDLDSSSIHYKGSKVALDLQYFVSNSFNLSLSYSHLNEEDYFTDSGEPDIKLEIENATLFLGNEWQWGSFSLGFDWIGVGQQISRKVNSEPNPEWTSSELSVYESRADSPDNKTSIEFPRISISLSF